MKLKKEKFQSPHISLLSLDKKPLKEKKHRSLSDCFLYKIFSLFVAISIDSLAFRCFQILGNCVQMIA